MPRPRKAEVKAMEVKTSLPPLEAIVPDDAVRMAEAVLTKWGATGAIRAFYSALQRWGATAPATQIPDVSEGRHIARMQRVVPMKSGALS
jgi:hypothetical protein